MRHLAADGLMILSDEAYVRYVDCKNLILEEIEFMKEDLDRSGDRLRELLSVSNALWQAYIEASDEAMEALS